MKTVFFTVNDVDFWGTVIRRRGDFLYVKTDDGTRHKVHIHDAVPV